MKRILIVDSSIERCLALSDFLGNVGFETGVADTPQRALKMLSEADPTPNFILLDIRAENMNNWFFYDQLKKTAKFCRVPVLLMDGNGVATEGDLDNKYASPEDAACLALLAKFLN